MRARWLAASAWLLAAGLGSGGMALAQIEQGPTQSRSGLGNASHAGNPVNSLPSGGENASTGPQAHPAYPSGSTTPNPGAAMVDTMPKPATGTLKSPPGVIANFRTGRAAGTPARHTVGQEGAGKLVR